MKYIFCSPLNVRSLTYTLTQLATTSSFGPIPGYFALEMTAFNCVSSTSW